MGHAADHSMFAGFSADSAARHAPAQKSGFLWRLFQAARAARERHANRDIADFIERSGGRLTDDIERQMTERFLNGHANLRH
jgi:hypothetical protein